MEELQRGGKYTALAPPAASPDAGARLENVEILQDVGNTHQSHRSQEPQAYPGPVQVDGDEGGRDGEVVHEGIQLQHEPELVRGCDELKKPIRGFRVDDRI